MHTSQVSVQTATTHAPISVKWKCGEVEMGNGRSGAIREGKLSDWSRQGLDASIALDQVNIIVSTSVHAVEALRSMVFQLANQVDTVLCQSSVSKQDLEQIDALLGQFDAIVSEAALGDVNLLRSCSGIMSIPYLITELQEAEEYNNFATMGMSISAVREETCGNVDALVGIYVLTTDEEQSVCWLNAPGFYQNTLEITGVEGCESMEAQIVEELVLFQGKLRQFDGQLAQIEAQFTEYKKRVGEVCTDLVLED